MFWRLEDIYSRKEWADLGNLKCTKISSTYLGLNSVGPLFNHFSSWYEKKILTLEGIP